MKPLPSLVHNLVASMQSQRSHKRKRTGKIASLPTDVRDRINLLLDEGWEYDVILKDIGPHAQGINHQNPSAPGIKNRKFKFRNPRGENLFNQS